MRINVNSFKILENAMECFGCHLLGSSNADVPIALDCLENMLIKRRKKVSIHRVLAFTKRIATLALHVQHNSSIAFLHLLRILMMVKVSDLSDYLHTLMRLVFNFKDSQTD